MSRKTFLVSKYPCLASFIILNLFIICNILILSSRLLLQKFICFREKAGNITTLFPWPSPHSKWRVGERLQITPRIVKYFVTRHTIKWLFRRLLSAPGSPVCFLVIWNRCSDKTKTFHGVLRGKILKNFWSRLATLARGFSDPPFWMRRRPWGRGWKYNVANSWLSDSCYSLWFN